MAERAKAKPKAAKGKVKGKAIAVLPKGGKGRKKPRIGHNSGQVDDEIILRNINAMNNKRKLMKKDQEQLDQSKGVYRSARKLAKKEGLNLDAYDDMVAKHESDHGKVITDAADTGRYLKLIDSPLAQMDLFQGLEAPAPKVDVALQGQQAGKEGVSADANPHTPGSADFQIWFENWQVGQGQIAQEMRKH